MNNSSKKQQTFGIKLWAKEDIVTPSILSIACFNVVICDVGDEVDAGDSKNTIVVRQVSELGEIFGMNLNEIERRCKVQYLMRISHRKYEIEKSREKVKEFAEILLNKRKTIEIRQFIKFTNFRRTVRQRCLKRYFTVWLISYYEGSLSTLNNQLVREEYFTSCSNHILLQKYFNSWKKVRA